MASIKALRDALASDLSPLGVTIHPAWPIDFEPPCAFVTAPLTASYVEAGPTFGTYTVNVDVVLLVPHSTADAGLDAIEALVESTLLNTVDWRCLGVDTPAPITVVETGAEYLGTVVHLSKQTIIEE